MSDNLYTIGFKLKQVICFTFQLINIMENGLNYLLMATMTLISKLSLTIFVFY